MKKYKNFIKDLNDEVKTFINKLQQEPGITFPEIVEGINRGSIKIETLGHNSNLKDPIDYFKKELNRKLEHTIEKAKKLKDNIIAVGYLYEKFVPGKALLDLHINCYDCGLSSMYGILLDEKTFTFIEPNRYWRLIDKKPNKYTAILTKEEILDGGCELHKLGITDKFVTEINVPTGELYFVNHFDTEEIYDNDDLNFSGLLGKYKLMQDLAKKDVGYGQMGNMSIEIFVNNDGTEIIIGEEYFYNSETNEEQYLPPVEGFKKIGEISLSVWRWQCADKQIIDKYNEKIKKEDRVIADVKPGTWVIEHYYDFMKYGDKSRIFSKLYLKK